MDNGDINLYRAKFLRNENVFKVKIVSTDNYYYHL